MNTSPSSLTWTHRSSFFVPLTWTHRSSCFYSQILFFLRGLRSCSSCKVIRFMSSRGEATTHTAPPRRNTLQSVVLSSVDLDFFQPPQQQNVCWLRHMLGESALQDTRGPSEGSFKLARSVHGHPFQSGFGASTSYANNASARLFLLCVL